VSESPQTPEWADAADALDQQASASAEPEDTDRGLRRRTSAFDEVNEADRLEQSQIVPDDDEDYPPSG